MPRDLRLLPRAEVHLHFVGSMSRSTLHELAVANGITLPRTLTVDAPAAGGVPGRRGWMRFQHLYEAARAVVRSAADVRRVLTETALAEAAAGVGWIEVQVTPGGYARTLGGLIPATEAFLVAATAAASAAGVGMGLILAANRTRPPQEAATLARLAARYRKDGVVGFGLSNDERAAPAREFAVAFRIAREAGLLLSPHAGELCGPEQVEEAVRLLRPDRLGHGVRAVEDPRVLDLLAREQIACEVCPASNVALGVYPEAAQVPLRPLLDAGVPVLLGSDDPLLFGSWLPEQYDTARSVHSLKDTELAQLARTSVEHSAAPDALRRALLQGIHRWATMAE